MYKDKHITVIRHRGTPNKATLPGGEVVTRQEKLWVSEWEGFVVCAGYDDHFLYVSPGKYLGSSLMCTCGSAAVITGPSGYVLDASPQGKMIVCLVHAQTGIHSTGGSKWV